MRSLYRVREIQMAENRQAGLGLRKGSVDGKRFNQTIVEDIEARTSQLRRKPKDHGAVSATLSTSGEEFEEYGSTDHS